MKRLYFVRHGESEFNRARVWSGSTDSPLTENGHSQAKLAGKKLREQAVSIDLIISSPFERALQTARHIASELDYPHEQIILHEQLVERNFGSLEGKRELLAATKYRVSGEAAIDHLENVEKLADLQRRIEGVLEYLHSLPHDTILVVGHGASGRALYRAVKKLSLDERGKRFDNAEVVRFI